ncbi:MAG: putative DNA modification/repair radical SAM protein, partial [Lachnospiraceae bacterium]|nr:putative DNA modification/repair radical SAM protein [Lachnospiraceae bacterium]
FNGYIHVKAIPGAAPEIVAAVGLLADRMSTNLELPTAEGLRQLAPNKTRATILKPMRQIQQGIAQSKRGEALRISRLSGGRSIAEQDTIGTTKWGFAIPDPSLPPAAALTQKADTPTHSLSDNSSGSLTDDRLNTLPDTTRNVPLDIMTDDHSDGQHDMIQNIPSGTSLITPDRTKQQLFVPAGQSTQMIVGATPEDDYQVLSVAEALYRRFDLKRVFYSAYIALNDDSSLPALGTKPPLLREHRLYQADWLLRFYGFQANELLTPERPNFNVFLDPKCEWALRHLEYFPVEINRAPYQLLLRIPGVGVKSAKRIVRARRGMKLDFDGLKRIGVVLKRAHYFITCNGKMMYPTKIDEDYITRNLIDLDRKKNWEIAYDMTYRQLSLFDDKSMWAGGISI